MREVNIGTEFANGIKTGGKYNTVLVSPYVYVPTNFADLKNIAGYNNIRNYKDLKIIARKQVLNKVQRFFQDVGLCNIGIYQNYVVVIDVGYCTRFDEPLSPASYNNFVSFEQTQESFSC